MTPSTSPSRSSHCRRNSAAITRVFAGVTQFAIGFSWIRISSGASISEEKLTIGTFAITPS